MSLMLGTLGYRQDGSVSVLPPWAAFLISVGRFGVEHRLPGRRLVVGVSVPTRAFAAAFCALGVAIAAYEDPEAHDPRQQLERLRSLPRGTPVRYRSGNHLYCGRFREIANVKGTAHIVIDMGGYEYRRPWYAADFVQLLEPEEEFVRRRLLATNPDFVRACLPGVDPFAHAGFTNLDCMIVGIKHPLRAEICDEPIWAITDGGVPFCGCLNDLLRCDAFELNANDHDRTVIVSAYGQGPPDKYAHADPPAVVFDGAPGFLRLRSHWRRSPWILVADRTSPSALDAAGAFNQELAMSIADAPLGGLGSIPDGIELAAFYEEAART
jgi:hypothetical protein